MLANRWSTAAGFLSGGEAQQLAVARALMSQAEDHPARRADARPGADHGRRRLRPARRAACRQGRTVFVVEQNARRALEIADRGYVLRTGRVAVEGPGPGAGRARGPVRALRRVIAHERAGPEPRRRPRARQHVRPAGARHLADLRRDAPRQLRPRRADHRRRLRRLRPVDARASGGGCWRRRSCWRPSSPRW